MIANIKVADPAGGAEECSKVSSGGFSTDAHTHGIDPVFLSMGAKPAHGRLAVMKLGRKNRRTAQSIADAGNRIAPPGKVSNRAGMFAAVFPSSTMNPQNRRHRTMSLIWQVKIQNLPRVAPRNIGLVNHGKEFGIRD